MPVEWPGSVVISRLRCRDSATRLSNKVASRQPQWHRYLPLLDSNTDAAPLVPRPTIVITRDNTPEGGTCYCVRLLF